MPGDRVRVLLVNPTSHLWRVDASGRARGARAFRFSMLSSLYVAASMPPGTECRIVDEDVEPLDFDADVDVVGVSFMTCNAPRAYQVAAEYRRRRRTVVFGGYHPTFMPHEAAQHADAVCVGDAETTVPPLMADYRAGRLRPIYVGEPGSLAGLPVPDRTLIRREAYVTPNAIQATRGCPHGCTFCSVSAFAGHRFRARPVREVVEEARGLGRWLLFMDDNIVADPDYAKELFAALAPLGKVWFSQASVRLASDPELLDLAARSGCRGVFVGFESLNEKSLSAWRKTPNRARDYGQVVARLHDRGIGVFGGFVFGTDDDDARVFPRTLGFLREARIDALQATILTPFPGTPLFDAMQRQGRIRTLDWGQYDFGHVVFEPARLSTNDLLRGQNWVQSQFYSWRDTSRRLLHAFGYIPPAVMLRAVAPLNLGYRLRHRSYGTFEKAEAFSPAVQD
jgi:radical SAM superfamily enzyme YgiQ (UPF0313 family)